MDLDLLFFDEEEEQIQRPLEDGQLDLVALAGADGGGGLRVVDQR